LDVPSGGIQSYDDALGNAFNDLKNLERRWLSIKSTGTLIFLQDDVAATD